MARLILATAEGQQAIELRSTNSLGRHPNNSIQLLDKIVSKEHCIIEQRDSVFVLRDLGSLNGTYINNERVRGEQHLRHGDEIALGATRARFDDGTGPAHGLLGDALHTPLGIGAPPQGNPPPPPPPAPYASPAEARSPPQAASSPQQPLPAATARGAMDAQPPPVASVGPVSPVRVAGGKTPSFSGTRVDVLDAARAIGAQIAVQSKGFAPFDQIARDPPQLKVDYERLRISWELTRDIGLERDLDPLLQKILQAFFKFVKADRGVILLREDDGSLIPRATHRRDGTDAPIQISSTILNHVITERASVLTHDASMDFAASKGRSMILNRISSAMVVPLLHENERDVLGVLWLDSESIAQFQPKDLEILTAVASQAARFIENTLLARKVEQEILVRERFSRLVAPNVAEQMISGQLEVRKGGQLVRELTVFNSDIRGFTAMSEGTTAELVVDMLNEYFELMVEMLFRHEGTLDKFMGDGIMAFWGAPVGHPDQAIRSVRCALDQMTILGTFNRSRMAAGLPGIAVGIGIHTGPCVVGYVGSSKALSYTAIGDTANTSARVCASALAGQVVVSETTLAKLENRFEFEELDPKQLKGKERPVRRFNIVRERTG